MLVLGRGACWRTLLLCAGLWIIGLANGVLCVQGKRKAKQTLHLTSHSTERVHVDINLIRLSCHPFVQEKIHGARIVGLHSQDGINLVNSAFPGSRPFKCWVGQPLELVVPQDTLWNDAVLAHNMDVLRLDPPSHSHPLADRFVVAGGMQAFQRDSSGNIMSEDPRFGIRLVRGHGWPPDWLQAGLEATALTSGNIARATSAAAPRRWAEPPEVVLHGRSPAGCIDNRPQYTGNLGCEFDGRLSLVHFRGTFRMYARSNLREGALAGGRFVQTSSSKDASHGSWTKWEPLQIEAVPSGSADVYFFAAQANPVDNSSLMALLPLSQPPHACIALTFSADGRRFSRPVNLRTSSLGWRTALSNGSGPIEWRSESHPAAGVVRRGDEVWLYIHESVPGVSMRLGRPRPSLRRYRLPVSMLEMLTRKALHGLHRG